MITYRVTAEYKPLLFYYGHFCCHFYYLVLVLIRLWFISFSLVQKLLCLVSSYYYLTRLKINLSILILFYAGHMATYSVCETVENNNEKTSRLCQPIGRRKLCLPTSIQSIMYSFIWAYAWIIWCTATKFTFWIRLSETIFAEQIVVHNCTIIHRWCCTLTSWQCWQKIRIILKCLW